MAALTAVIPLKALNQAKGRLSPALTPARRRSLATSMFHHVASVCLNAPGVDDVLVVAGDRAGASIATAAGARAVVAPRPGLHAALEHADALLAGVAATLVVAADLPLLRPDDIAAARAAAGMDSRAGPSRAAVVIAPTRDGGTGGLLRCPGDVMGTAFGPGSATAHRVLAAEAGLVAGCLETDGFGLDLDTVGHLRDLADVEPRLLPWAV